MEWSSNLNLNDSSNICHYPEKTKCKCMFCRRLLREIQISREIKWKGKVCIAQWESCSEISREDKRGLNIEWILIVMILLSSVVNFVLSLNWCKLQGTTRVFLLFCEPRDLLSEVFSTKFVWEMFYIIAQGSMVECGRGQQFCWIIFWVNADTQMKSPYP